MLLVGELWMEIAGSHNDGQELAANALLASGALADRSQQDSWSNIGLDALGVDADVEGTPNIALGLLVAGSLSVVIWLAIGWAVGKLFV
jgi:hypothetical protein